MKAWEQIKQVWAEQTPVEKAFTALFLTGAGFGILTLFSGKKSTSPAATTSNKMTKEEFIKTGVALAKQIEAKVGIPALFAIGQWALESADGTKAPGNNFMGIKATGSWKGKKQLLWTWEAFKTKEEFKKYATWDPKTLVFKNGKWYAKVKTWFRAYDSFEDAVNDWSEVLQKDRYKAAFKTKDPYLFAAAVAKAGYGTGAKYLETVQAKMNTYKKYL